MGIISDQAILFCLLGVVFGLLVWGKVRYDLVAFGALIVAIVIGVVPREEAFSGFGHRATVIIALVLIVSRGLSNSGAIELVARYLIVGGRSLFMHIGLMSGVAALLSAVMNNVAALSLLMPIDIQAAKKAKRSAALTLMPLSFASILGGLITLIGTPPNIIIASFREQALGEPFGMFDFTPVGTVTALAGIVFIVAIGWRLVPLGDKDAEGESPPPQEDYIAEVRVAENSSMIERQVRDLDAQMDEADVAITGLVRRGKRLPGRARREVIREGDILVIEADAEHIDAFVGAFDLEYVGAEKYRGQTDEALALIEAVVPENSRIEGRSALGMRLLYRHGITLLGVSRHGKTFRERVRKLETRAGDVLLLLGPLERLDDTVKWLGCLPLKERDLQVIQRQKALIAVASFALAIAAATFGVIHLPEALALVCMVMVGFSIVPLKEIYTSIEWPVIVLLGSMIPIGAALEASGGTALIAQQVIDFAEGYGPVVVLMLLMVVTMTLSDLLNNAATAVIAAPIGIDIATRLGVSPDPFLMAVAIAASCAFLTPIGHQNNTLVMGPGGYRFGDYWRMGLPLEVIVVAVSLPMILWVWPL
ncbi:MAG TPA: SLC13 family permease [Gammaproteobacteria bacterium]|nr:SLC13 family permease [Gammaproteobacteria bacterium]